MWLFNIVMCIFFSNSVGSYDPRSNPIIYDPTYLLRFYVESRFWQHWGGEIEFVSKSRIWISSTREVISGLGIFIIFRWNYSFLNAIHISNKVNHGNNIEFIFMENKNFNFWKPFWRNQSVNKTESINISSRIRKMSMLIGVVFIFLLIRLAIRLFIIKLFVNF